MHTVMNNSVSRPVWARRVQGTLLGAALTVIAAYAGLCDGGLFTHTAHGDPTTGAQRDPSLPTGNCVQCHTTHGAAANDFGLWTADDNSLCFTCHADPEKTYPGSAYSESGHAMSSSNQDGRPVGLCVQCHNPHGNGDASGPYSHLTSQLEEQTCYVCHGTGSRPVGAANVESQVTKEYAHPVTGSGRLHDDWNERTGTVVDPNPLFSGAGRHVECDDCHNPHMAGAAPRPAFSSNIGQAQIGSWGVVPEFPGAAWTEPTRYTVQPFTDTTRYEYTLCVKCHSNWAWGSDAPFTQSGLQETNQALEFNPRNPSYHNVTGQPAAEVPAASTVYNTSAPLGYVNGWGPKSAMACTDCHAGDGSQGADPAPHGSIYNYMLKLRFKAEAGASDNTMASGTENDLCFNCHDWNSYGYNQDGTATNFRDASLNLHTLSSHARYGCVSCHAAVPHGFKRLHMIVYTSDGAPYYAGVTGAPAISSPAPRLGKLPVEGRPLPFDSPADNEQEVGGILAYEPNNNGKYQESNCKTSCHSHQNADPVDPLP